MRNLAKLNTTVTLTWENRRGCDRDCTVDVAYTFDGTELRIVETHIVGSDDIDDETFDELLHDAVMEVAPEAYAEWQADRADYLADLLTERRAA